MKSIRKIIEYAFYIIIFLAITFSIAFFRSGSRKLILDLSKYKPINTELAKDFESKNKVIYFWATWCGVCETNLPMFKTSYRLFNGKWNTEFISIEEGSSTPEYVKKYLDKNEILYPTIIADSNLLQSNQISGYPTIFFVNSQNEVKLIDTGLMSPVSMFIRILFLSLG
ncbi:MAG TPA: TlpA disulfide reductase family protein [Leptospiraceae bacterium]|nr:TlpA disulfide reductase family protein [Leptospiraceae bacterium]HMZ63878.1 TlpA disulfide reductase family protein [Leptospiraceae bacterium]HNA06833.1 TlpA disulfide reductase family protein [Leptospiraceae bacterium]HNC01287.1 TlpA disulfide reductase family protein [Leptospiraceae bacterium]HNE07970.1 TlpA disulfide reductase family protein [Leptospiraceae bacterium]